MNTSLHDLLHLAVLATTLLLLKLPVTANAAEAKAYPLTTCIVTGNELGSMGKVITKVHEGREIRLCCKPCVKKFEANPDRYLSKISK